jgi:hypothetical protein
MRTILSFIFALLLTVSALAQVGGGVSSAYRSFSTPITLAASGTIAWDTAVGQVATTTLTASSTLAAPTNLVNGGVYTLHVVQGGSGSYTITWNAVFKWPAATAPTLTTTVGKRDVFTFISDGTNLYGVGALNY